MNEKGILIVLSGPSGAGKDTVLKKLLAKDKNLKLSVSATTRTPRKNEKNEEDYFFISKAEFIQLISKGEMLEHAEYCGNYYGTPSYQVNKWLDRGRDVLLEIEVNGGAQIREKCPQAVRIFILPPSLKELRNRLVYRATDSLEIVNKRLEIAKEEIKCAQQYDYIVINDSIDRCVEDIFNIINCEKLRAYRRNNLIEEVLNNA